MKRSGRSLSPERQEAVKAYLVRVIRERFRGSHTNTAKALGLSQAQISDVAAGRSGPGLQLVEALADVEHATMDEVCGRKPPSRRVRSTPEDTVPERAAAVAFARANAIPEAAIARIVSAPVAQLTAEDWYWRMKVAAIETAVEGAASSKPPITMERPTKR